MLNKVKFLDPPIDNDTDEDDAVFEFDRPLSMKALKTILTVLLALLLLLFLTVPLVDARV